jgi:hypothetical protein
MQAEAEIAHQDLDAETAKRIKVPQLIEVKPDPQIAERVREIMALNRQITELQEDIERINKRREFDQSNCRHWLIDVLSEIEKVGDKLPVALTRKCQGISKQLGIDDKSFELEPEDRPQPKPQQQPKAAEPGPATPLLQSKQPVPEIKKARAKSNGKAEVLPAVVNGLQIVQREDGKFVVVDPTKEKNNTIAICDEMEEAVKATQKKKPEEIQSAQVDSASA